MTRVTLICLKCPSTARRELTNDPGCRGVHETDAEPAMCPKGHGRMVRQKKHWKGQT